MPVSDIHDHAAFLRTTAYQLEEEAKRLAEVEAKWLHKTNSDVELCEAFLTLWSYLYLAVSEDKDSMARVRRNAHSIMRNLKPFHDACMKVVRQDPEEDDDSS